MHTHQQVEQAKKMSAQKKMIEGSGPGTITLMAMVMMNVTIVASLANDAQQSFYGLESVTFFIIGALIFFLPTGMVAAELASGWGQRGGIFRWVGEAIGSGFAFSCLLILWFQTSFTFGSGVSSAAATIGFYTLDYNWAVQFAQNPSNELIIICCWLLYYWGLCFLATKGVKWFSGIAKYGVLLGTFLPLGVMTVLAVVWLAMGHQPNIEFTPQALVPQWHGLTTLALAAGVFFSFAGIDMNAAHIKQLKNPKKQYPLSIFIAMILVLLIFIVGTLIIAIVIPENQINVLYSLYATYRELGAAVGCPWLYLVFVYLGLGAGAAGLIANLAGPSYMLGEAGRSGFLPKILQNKNKHGMPSRLMYLQMVFMTLVAFIVFLLPNVEGFVILITQAITILYMLYYVAMFVSFLKLRYQQPNRPRAFKVPGGKFGAWFVALLGIAACLFGIVLAIYPPAQVESEVGSPVTYVTVILLLIAAVLIICFVLYRISRKHDWVDPDNQFAPFTWQIEGLSKPGKVLSNIPSEVMAAGQSPMGMPIKHPYKPDAHVDEPEEQLVREATKKVEHHVLKGDPAAINAPIKTTGVSSIGPVTVMSQMPRPVPEPVDEESPASPETDTASPSTAPVQSDGATNASPNAQATDGKDAQHITTDKDSRKK